MIKFRKAVLRALLTFAVAGLPFVVSAGGGVSIKADANEKKAMISLREMDANYVQFSIENDAENIVFYSDFVDNTADFAKVFDFSVLADGDYVIVVKWNNEIIKQSIEISGNSVLVRNPKN
jgi:hypothetical protein